MIIDNEIFILSAFGKQNTFKPTTPENRQLDQNVPREYQQPKKQ